MQELRQQAKEIPYEAEEMFPDSQKIKVFESHSPLELALLSEENPLPRKKENHRLPLWEQGKDGWEPLSKEEWQNRERDLAKKAVEMGATLADSLYMSYFSNSILWTTQQFNAYRHHLAEHYRLHFKFSDDDAYLSYNLRY